MPLTFKLRTEQAKRAVNAAAYDATVETFELDIVPEAKRNSPVTAEGMALNIADHKKRPGGTGTNRRSIDSQVEMTAEGPKAEMFTQSGYGAYVELGTSKMRAQPYLFPAFMKFIKGMGEKVKAKL